MPRSKGDRSESSNRVLLASLLFIASLIFFGVAYTNALPLTQSGISSSVTYYTQNAVVNNPLIGIVNTQLLTPNYGGGSPWYSPQNAALIDEKYAVNQFTCAETYPFDSPYQNLGYNCVPSSNNPVSEYLTFQLFNFSIPTQALIQGVIVQVVGHFSCTGTPNWQMYYNCNTNAVFDRSVKLVAYGQASGTDHWSHGASWPHDVDTAIQYGGSSDQWGLNLTQNMMMRPDFGFAIATQANWHICILTQGDQGNGCQYTTAQVTVSTYIDAAIMTAFYYLPVPTTTTSAYTSTFTSNSLTSTSTGTTTITSSTIPATVTMTYSPTTYTWVTPTVTYYTQTPTTVTQTLTTATANNPTLSVSLSQIVYGVLGSVFMVGSVLVGAPRKR